MRLTWRLTHKAPPLPDGMSALERFAAKFTHIGFYVLMIGIPISGWIMTSTATPKITTYMFDLFAWPDFPGISRSEAAEVFWKNTHAVMAYAAAFLILLHVGAALKHHFINKDNVLIRMIPLLKSKG
jgi:cytochrome b561